MRANLTSLRNGVDVPEEADLNGAAWALVRLQDTYNLSVNDLVEGEILGTKAVKELSGRSSREVHRFGLGFFFFFFFGDLWVLTIPIGRGDNVAITECVWG